MSLAAITDLILLALIEAYMILHGHNEAPNALPYSTMSVAGDCVEPIRPVRYPAVGNETTPLLPSQQTHFKPRIQAVRKQNIPQNRRAQPITRPPPYTPRNRIERSEDPKRGRIPYWIIAAAVAIILVGILSLSSLYFSSQPLSPEERQMYRNSGIYWGAAQPLNCLEEYHNRNYTAQLQNITHNKGFDMNRACESLDIEIQNHTYESPNECRQQGQFMYGYWTVNDQKDCTVDDEIQKYRNSGMSWNTPIPAPHCYSYDKREYNAELINIPRGYDLNKACRYIPVKIQDHTIEQPDVCERRESSQYGKWFASNQMDCRPYWGPLRDVGCQESGKKRLEAPLWNLVEGDDYYGMCASTPARWHGRDYEHPTNCDYRKREGIMVGIWDVEDCS